MALALRWSSTRSSSLARYPRQHFFDHCPHILFVKVLTSRTVRRFADLRAGGRSPVSEAVFRKFRKIATSFIASERSRT